MDTHPYNPPMVFVKPTSTMQIKPGQYVDANGKVDMPFIRDWRHVSKEKIILIMPFHPFINVKYRNKIELLNSFTNMKMEISM